MHLVRGQANLGLDAVELRDLWTICHPSTAERLLRWAAVQVVSIAKRREVATRCIGLISQCSNVCSLSLMQARSSTCPTGPFVANARSWGLRLRAQAQICREFVAPAGSTAQKRSCAPRRTRKRLKIHAFANLQAGFRGSAGTGNRYCTMSCST